MAANMVALLQFPIELVGFYALPAKNQSRQSPAGNTGNSRGQRFDQRGVLPLDHHT
jgi:hypothetical protein